MDTKRTSVYKVVEIHKLLGKMLIGVGVFNVLDYFLTLYALDQGFREGNPVMNIIINTAYFSIVKLLIVPLCLIFLWHIRNKVGFRIYYYVSVVFFAYMSLAIYYTWLFWSGYL